MIHIDCPKCGIKIEGKVCAGCGVDFVLHNLAQDMSNKYYNAGLKKAEENDISAAIRLLDTALKINKRNIAARNLLGLCFYAKGHIGEALREWVVSSNYNKTDNPAKKYLDGFKNNLTALEKYSEAMIKYNEALVYMEQFSEDLAVIRLKRAIEVLPNFVDAMNLLALFYIKADDKTRAAGLVEKVLAIDKGNDFANRYYFDIFQKKYGEKVAGTSIARPQSRTNANQPKQTEAKTQPTSNPFSARTQKVFTKSSPLSGIISAVASMGAMFLFMYFLIFPGMLSDRDNTIREMNTNIQNIATSHQNAIADLQAEINEFDNEITRLNDNIAQLELEKDAMQQSMWVYDAQRLLNGNMPLDALEILSDVQVLNLPENVREIYAEVRRVATPLVEQQYFAAGTALFNAGNFAEARINLERAAIHTLSGSDIGGDILYWLGRIAEIDGDIPLARIYYQNALENHPTFNRRWAATARLNAIS
ncbi:MAG: tetratricopeptide repeat protein [Defluviitaleaceae bacterium]|nr:tetratricopeptide repeat protein [Defluviitaleaceae bacterium]